ncbi:NB-ARC domain-containing protein [Dactylosporangium cerinum]|uniref:NB-ARC domain-containing protein n=1 Tax=Dactylosporangium cerinum TaxID=1434730 RepID=A0ABV9WB49_9ACTN
MASGMRTLGRWWPLAVAIAGLSVLGIVAWRLATLDLDRGDKISSVVGAVVSIVSLGLSAVELFRRGQVPSAPVGAPITRAPGMTSLLLPARFTTFPLRGRDLLLAQSRAHRRVWPRGRRSSVWVLHGPGGSGKTALAVAIGEQTVRGGGQVWWVNATDAVRLSVALRQLALEIGAADHEVRDAWAGLRSAPDLVWGLLERYPRRWLLVFDGADDAGLLTAVDERVVDGRGWVRHVRSSRGRVVVTTRDGGETTWPQPWCEPWQVGSLAPDEGAQMLLDRSGPWAGDHEAAAALARHLGGLPLAMDLAGRYLGQARRLPVPGAVTDFAGYLRQLREATAILIGDDASILAQTWERSLELLEARGLTLSRSVLWTLAHFENASVPFWVLDPALLSGGDPDALRDTLQGLIDLGLLRLVGPIGSELAAVDVHPLIRAAGRNSQGGQVAALERAARLVAAADPGDPQDPTNWPRWQAITPHLLAITAAADPLSNEVIEAVVSATHRGLEHLAAVGMYASAASASAAMAARVSSRLGERHPTTISVRVGAARWAGLAGDAAAARAAFAALAEPVAAALGPNDPRTLRILFELASWTGEAGDPAGARDQLLDLLPARVRVLGPESPEVLTHIAECATWTEVAGDPATARDHLANLIPVVVRVLGPHDPECLRIQYELAVITGVAGDPVSARDRLAELLPAREHTLGAQHPRVLTHRAELARWTAEAGAPSDARRQLAALLSVSAATVGPQHPDTERIRAYLARL